MRTEVKDDGEGILFFEGDREVAKMRTISDEQRGGFEIHVSLWKPRGKYHEVSNIRNWTLCENKGILDIRLAGIRHARERRGSNFGYRLEQNQLDRIPEAVEKLTAYIGEYNEWKIDTENEFRRMANLEDKDRDGKKADIEKSKAVFANIANAINNVSSK
jgi:hypothetical protein